MKLRALLFLPAFLAAAPATTTIFEPGSPRAAAESLTAAIASGDAATLHDLLYAATPAERHMADAMIAMSKAIARLRPIAIQRYGEVPARIVTGDPDASASEQHAKLESAFQQIDGDTARLAFPDPAADPIKLRRIDGRWRFSIADRAAGLSPEELETRAADLSSAASIVEEVATLCQGGKWQTPNDVVIAIQERILKAQQARLPATQPASQPTTLPH